MYVDRILKGAKPAHCRWSSETKVEIVITLKTAKAIGFTIRQQLLLQANKGIE